MDFLKPDLAILGPITVFMPLFSFLFIGLFGNFLGKRLSGIIATVCLLISALAAWGIFLPLLSGSADSIYPYTITLFNWIHVGDLRVDWQIYLNQLTATMMMVVTTISSLVHLYSIGYMSHDKSVPRFMAYLSFFTFAMLMLVSAQNLLQLFFGWEGVGLASYLLIGFWHHKDSANAAAIKAFLVNRVGDIGFALGIAAAFFLFSTVDIPAILSTLDAHQDTLFTFGGFEIRALEVVAILLFIGAMGKSAQIGLHTWLPDAMEGPTPVSALIHAATMVTAGVFLVCRMAPLYEVAPYARTLIVIVGATTAFFAATIAPTQFDIKRVIAYSTCSQLGYMFLAAGLSAYNIALFHLVTHAFFKSLLFLCSGAVIHAVSDEQDMRKMGGLYRLIPATYTMMWIGSLALGGLPIFAGYYSKDAIILSAWLSSGDIAFYGYLLGMGAALLTALYSWRLLFMTFHGKTRLDEKTLAHVHEPGGTMLIPLFVLSIGATLSGMGFDPLFLNPKNWGTSLVVSTNTLHDSVSFLVHIGPTLLALCGILVAYLFYMRYPQVPALLAQRFRDIYEFLYHKWYFDELYDRLFVVSANWFGQILWQRGDLGIIDRYGPDGIAGRSWKIASRSSQIQTGYLNHYALGMAFGGLIFVCWIFMSRMIMGAF